MARQKGPIKIEGTIGDISFYKKDGKHFARNKGGVSAERIKKDPRFARTRENLAEFGAANAGTKLMRKAFRMGMQKVKDARLSNRLMPKLLKVLQSDALNVRGARKISEGTVNLLANFQFSSKVPFDTVFYLEPSTTVDLTAGTAQVVWPDFSPVVDVRELTEATHLRLFSIVATVDFDALQVESYFNSSSEIELTPTLWASFTHDFTFTANAGLPLYIALGIEFVQELNGVFYPLRNGSFNAMEIYHIET